MTLCPKITHMAKNLLVVMYSSCIFWRTVYLVHPEPVVEAAVGLVREDNIPAALAHRETAPTVLSVLR